MNEQLPIIETKTSLNNDQTTFNDYILKINTLKTAVDEVEAQIKQARVRIDEEITPLQEQVVDYRQAYVELLDKASDMFYFSMYEKRQMKAMILEESFTLISQAGRKHLKAIHDKYADTPYDAIEQEANQQANLFVQDFVKEKFGVDADNLDLEDWNSFKELSEKLPKAASFNTQELPIPDSKKQSRVLYAQLAKYLHPDTESDPQKKQEKTKLMQVLTEAYQSEDFFELLRLEALYAPQGSNHSIIDAEQLKTYNEALRKQILELEVKLKVLKNPPEPMLNVYEDYCGDTPEISEEKFNQKRLAWEKDLNAHRTFINQLQDRYNLRTYLRKQRYNDEPTPSLSDFFPVLKLWGL
ncbi:hypothetical protein BKI52_17350 [marine bacterium AO1-C]|nr:hypothetical protein BKI52_17350 [marine bacterium AO1-C]